MIVIFLTVAINYYLISFAAITFDKPFLQVEFSSLAEAIAYLTSGFLIHFLGPKASISTLMALSAIGAILLIATDS